MDKLLKDYQISLAAEAIYAFWYNCLCDVYLEAIKPVMQLDSAEPANAATKHATQTVLHACLSYGLRLLHPFMPMVTEELYHRLALLCGQPRSTVMLAKYPEPADAVGALRSAAAEETMETLMKIGGAIRALRALYLKGALDAQRVRAARSEVFARLASVGELLEPAEAGIFSGLSRRVELQADLGGFWQSVSEGPRLRALTHGPEMKALMSSLLGQTARAHDYMFLRAGVRGRATGLHFDYPFFTRAHDQVYTTWTPLGDVPIEQGPLALVGSLRKAVLRAEDLAIYCSSAQRPMARLAGLAKQTGLELLAAGLG
jgi:hypothetical protein